MRELVNLVYSRTGRDDRIDTPKMAVFEKKKTNRVTLDDTLPLSCTIETAQNVKDHTVC